MTALASVPAVTTTGPGSTPSAGSGSAQETYGLLRLAGHDVALPLSALREVVARPASLTPLPVVAVGLLGAMRLRSMVLPVVDLRPVLGRPELVQPDQVVVVVAHGGHLVGLVADEVRGVTQVREESLLPVRAAGERLLLSHAFQHGPEGEPVSLLDAEVLLALPGVPTVEEGAGRAGVLTARGTATGESNDVVAGVDSLTLVRCGSHSLGIAVADIHTTIPVGTLTPSVLTGGPCIGVVEHAGVEVPVVDPLQLLGLPPLAPEDVDAGVVVDLGHGLVVLAVSELVRLRSTRDAVLPVPPHAVARTSLLRGMAEHEDGTCMVLDGDALRADARLTALAAMNNPASVAGPAAPPASGTGAHLAPSGAAHAVPAAGAAHLTYSVGAHVASPLHQVAEILAFPTSLTPTAAPGVLGLLVHRGNVVPVVCLPTLVGRASPVRPASACLLLVEVDGERVGFAVDELGEIRPLAWSDPDPAVRPMSGAAERVLHESPLVQVAGDTRMVPALDLHELARRVRAAATEGDADPAPTSPAQVA